MSKLNILFTLNATHNSKFNISIEKIAMRILLIFLMLSLVFDSKSQNAGITILPMQSTEVHPFTSTEVNRSENDFQFAIVTDRTGDKRPGVFMDAINKLNLLQPEFVMSVGDLIDGYTENIPVLERQWEEFDGFIKQLEMPFFYVPGNHDITNQVMENLWKERLGDTYYAFIYKGVLFLCLNSEDQKRGAGRGTISDKQFDWISKTLTENENVKHTLVFMHQPLWTLEDTKRWKDVENLLKNRSHHVFTGHYHRYTKYERNQGKYFVLATTGGRSNLRGPGFGEFDHVVWVTMKNGEAIVANLLLEGVWDENVVTEEVRNEINYLQDKSPIEFQLIYTDDIIGKEAKIVASINNDEDVPLKVRFNPGISFDLIIYGETKEIVIPPNSVGMYEMTMLLKNKQDLNNIRPATLNATVSYVGRSETDIKLPFEYRLKPIKKNFIEKAKKKISVDANLKDWEDLSRKILSENDGSVMANFDLKYDKEMLYLAVKVKDDKVISYGSDRPWTQDYIGICFNAEIAEKSAMSVGEGWYENEMYFLMTPEMGKNESQTWKAEKLPEGSQYACKTDQDGYVFEWAIPLSYIQKYQGEDWQSFRFNLIMGDKDIDTEETKTYFWEENWRGENNYIGSGLFFKSKP